MAKYTNVTFVKYLLTNRDIWQDTKIESWEKNKDFKCYSCDMTFSHQDELQQHTSRVHKNDKIYQCDFCKVFTHKHGHLTNTKIELMKKKQRIQLSILWWDILQQYELQNHTRIADGNYKTYQCDFCYMVLHIDEHMARHKDWSHAKYKYFKC